MTCMQKLKMTLPLGWTIALHPNEELGTEEKNSKCRETNLSSPCAPVPAEHRECAQLRNPQMQRGKG